MQYGYRGSSLSDFALIKDWVLIKDDRKDIDERISPNAAYTTGVLKIDAPRLKDLIRRIRIKNDGTLDYMRNDDYFGVLKVYVKDFRGGTVECGFLNHNNTNYANVAFYNSDFPIDAFKSNYIISAHVATWDVEDSHKVIDIPENAVMALIEFEYSKEFNPIILRTRDSEDTELGRRINWNLNSRVGMYSHIITDAECRAYRWINQDGSVTINNNDSYKQNLLATVKIDKSYMGGKVNYTYFRRFDNTQFNIAFYKSDGTFISGRTNRDEFLDKNNYTIDIPEEVDYLLYSADAGKFDEGKTIADYPLTFYQKEGRLSIYDNKKQIERGEKYYMEPLGVNDNLIRLAYTINYNNMPRPDQALFFDDAVGLYAIKVTNTLVTNGEEGFKAGVCLKIKKNANPDRVIELRFPSGVYLDVKQDEQERYLYWQLQENITARVLRNDDDYIWIWCVMEWAHQSITFTSYSNLDKSSHDSLEIDLDRSFVLPGNYSLPDYVNVDFDRKYYTRPEKLHSRIAGKTAIVFSDSLSYFCYSLVNDWGLNVIIMSIGGGRMSYWTNNEATWVCNDSMIQAFKKLNVKNVDFIIFACGANDPNMEDCDAETVKFVLNNKRWFDSDAETDPFASLEESDKLRFSSSSCTYAAAYSLGKLYKNAVISIIPPYRTPGMAVTDWDVDKYSEVLFNGRFITAWNVLRGMAEKLGGIFIENWTRDSVATAEAYHGEDGVHPATIIAQDMASNIGHALSRYHDNILDGVKDASIDEQ